MPLLLGHLFIRGFVMNKAEQNQFESVCKVLLNNHEITNVNKSGDHYSVYINNVGVNIDNSKSLEKSLKSLTDFMNLIRLKRI